jgi:hypothetical protein
MIKSKIIYVCLQFGLIFIFNIFNILYDLLFLTD